MLSRQTVSAFRFGFGLSPGERAPATAEGVLASLTAPVYGQALGWPGRLALHDRMRDAQRAGRDGQMGAEDMRREANLAYFRQAIADHRLALSRPLLPGTGFRERLVAFWADHFAVQANNRLSTSRLPDMHETAIRPHVGGRFADMLRAVLQHPSMLAYLDQTRSMGPASRAGQRTGKGLNENLAREVLELHTLGVSGRYGQRDVRQLAELLTGLSVDRDGFLFRTHFVEPGAETVLGRSYGGPGTDGLSEITRVLDDLALHPDTAHHLSRKLVVHFLGAPAPDDLVSRMAQAYLRADSDLTAAYGVLLEDPRAWEGPFVKVRTPFEFVVAAMRAAGIRPEDIEARKPRQFQREILRPLTEMGQPIGRPDGPDGWPEAPEAWITPATLATRLRWATGFAEEVLADRDPRIFLETALGDSASAVLRFAVAGAERRSEGAALVLASPEFNRR